jgi:hypothetical protein
MQGFDEVKTHDATGEPLNTIYVATRSVATPLSVVTLRQDLAGAHATSLVITGELVSQSLTGRSRSGPASFRA